MASTTNYSWTTPDDTALVKDGAAAIRTLGSSIDTTTKALNPSTTLGDIEYRSATANTNTRLPIGSTGNILTVSGGVPTWAAPSGGGKVLQVVQAVYSSQTTVASTTYSDSGLSASITPSSASSKILIMVSQSLGGKRDTYARGVGFQILRGATSIRDFGSGVVDTTNYSNASTTLSLESKMQAFIYLDSPATTSSTTYKTQININTTSNSGEAYAQYSGSTSTITLMEIGA